MCVNDAVRQWKHFYKQLWKDGIKTGENLGVKLRGTKDDDEKETGKTARLEKDKASEDNGNKEQ